MIQTAKALLGSSFSLCKPVQFAILLDHQLRRELHELKWW